METLLAPYRVKWQYRTGEWALAGRDSVSVLETTRAYGDTDTRKPAVTIGNFVQKSGSARIILGGEHHNNEVVNTTLSSWPDAKYQWSKKGITHKASFSRGPVEIGSNVVLSENCIILSGVKIGDGAVIGAGSVVTKDVPPYAIVGGNPAKVLRYRFDEQTIKELLAIRWWDFTHAYFTANFGDIQQLNKPDVRQKYLNLSNEYYDNTKHYLVFKNADKSQLMSSMQFVGVEIDGKFTEEKDLPEMFRLFISQLYQPQGSTFYLIKDIFTYSGMVEAIPA
ncbi:MAG: antibiotic acetyltransferase [Proteobacteria bacterium]|nr:antibiotic acetyltransferase [Pseudomonadota bacterium]